MSELVLVTGSSRGIGAGIAKMYARRPDTTVLVNYKQDRAGAEQTKAAVEACGAPAHVYQADVSDPVSVRELGDKIRAQFGGQPLTTLVNNAGCIVRPAGWLEATDEKVVETIRTNLLSVLWTSRTFIPEMSAARRGHIVNLVTTYAVNGAAPVLAYTAAKAGVAAVTTALAAELGESGVRVNAVAPGNIDTDMTWGAGPDVVKWAIGTTPLGRLGTVDDVAQAVAYLEDAAFVTGHTVVVDGGQLMKI